MKQPKRKNKIRRGRGFAKKCSQKSLTIIGNNSAGIKSKKDSLQNLIKQLSPGVGVVMLQETKLYKKGSIKFKDMCVFEQLRGVNEGGGLMTLVHENLKPVQIPMKTTSKMSENMLVVEGIIGKIKVRFLYAYMESKKMHP